MWQSPTLAILLERMPSSRMYVYGTWVLGQIHTYLSEQAGLGFARTMCWYSAQGYYIYMALPDKKI